MKPHSPSLQRSPGCILWPALPETDLGWTGLLNWDTIKEVDNLFHRQWSLVGKARQWLPTLSSAGAGKELSLTVTAPSALSILVINIRMKVHFQNYIWSINQSWTLMVKKYKKNPAHLLSCTQLHSDFSAPGSNLMMDCSTIMTFKHFQQRAWQVACDP